MLPGPNTHTINTSKVKGNPDIRQAASEHFDAEIDGFDVVMEAVGIPATFDMCQNLVGKGGTIANIGVHSTPVSLNIDRLWPRGTSECRCLIVSSTDEIPQYTDFLSSEQLFRWRLSAHTQFLVSSTCCLWEN